jgi:hypothetical protein
MTTPKAGTDPMARIVNERTARFNSMGATSGETKVGIFQANG